MEEEKPLSVFESAEVVSLRPGDVVLFRCPQVLAPLARERAVGVLNTVFPDHETMILDGGQDISILRPRLGIRARLMNLLRK